MRIYWCWNWVGRGILCLGPLTNWLCWKTWPCGCFQDRAEQDRGRRVWVCTLPRAGEWLMCHWNSPADYLCLWLASGWGLPVAEERCQNECGRQQIKNDLYLWPDQSFLTYLLQLIPLQTSISPLSLAFHSWEWSGKGKEVEDAGKRKNILIFSWRKVNQTSRSLIATIFFIFTMCISLWLKNSFRGMLKASRNFLFQVGLLCRDIPLS